jgi:hypothetical protein
MFAVKVAAFRRRPKVSGEGPSGKGRFEFFDPSSQEGSPEAKFQTVADFQNLLFLRALFFQFVAGLAADEPGFAR